VNTSSLTKPIAGVTAVAVVLASLLAFFTFGSVSAQAQSPTIKVNPINIDVGDVAEGQVETITVDITNTSNEVVEIGEIDLEVLGDGLDLDDLEIKLLDGNGTPIDAVLNILNGVLTLDLEDPLVIPDNGQPVELVLSILPQTEGVINLTIDLLDNVLGTVLETITIQGESRTCSDLGQTDDPDIIIDTPDDEVICGLGGGDTINATQGGDDVILGGPGDDTINFKDGVKKEFANGNDGLDLCKPKDKKDKIKNCGTTESKRK
jgi:hypothetical protein